MIIKSMALGPIMANCFILGCEQTKESVVIDPGDEADRILLALAGDNLKVVHIINTHGHFDHVSANRPLKDATGADLIIHRLDAPMLDSLSDAAAGFGLSAENSPPPDRHVEDGDIISFGNMELKVIHTPGHTPGGISLYTDGYLFAGDTLFQGSIGRTDFPGGDYQTLISSIRDKLFSLGDEVRVLSGHGPETLIGTERRHNPFAGMGV
ncbi:Hydroxyacylglutathione hydrolase GloC [Candidatus Desulfarcum epimagneticum]|uniref:Hydroxyacylglutathione hydrolase GloC n=1 Tax=uncultured Desulfobacteraceae bacterium TaxID=218296 RepID=A0A484HF27_9BACT|nr:Hydroxyacylglutathione hydrolase GloC [uncultured Desulfobacteraceae bacterium]